MGSENGFKDEKPVHRVTFGQGFFMGKYEVTQGQWQAVMDSNPSNFKGDDNLPVEHVSWNDAQEFINKLNEMNDGYRYRLPSEAEWEYACRAGTTGDYYDQDLDDIEWYSDNYGQKTHRVGSKRVNAFGLNDMLGNVSEWCRDWYVSTYKDAPLDGSAWMSGGEQKYRVLRGGSWFLFPPFGRSASRSSPSPDHRSKDVGFRLVAVGTRDVTVQSGSAPTTHDALQPQKKTLTVVSSSETAEGSRTMILSDLPLSDYSAYRGRDRLYVLIPGADASRIASGLRGRGFSDLRSQKRGNDALISFRLLAGSTARVSQKMNTLDIIITVPALVDINRK